MINGDIVMNDVVYDRLFRQYPEMIIDDNRDDSAGVYNR